jgi:hypothetical protein
MPPTQRRPVPWSRLALAVLAFTLLLPACSMLPKRWSHSVTVTEVVELSRHGVEAEVIVEKMRRGGTIYLLSDEQRGALRTLGVTPVVIAYMQESYEEAVVEHPRLADDSDLSCFYLGSDGFWYAGGPWGFHPDC